MSASNKDLSETAAHWNEASGKWGSGTVWWQAGSELQRHFNEMVSRSPDVDWVEYTLVQYYQDRLPVDKCLSLGCGNGHLERNLARRGFFEECDAYDIADQQIMEAASLAISEGIHNIRYHVADINEIALEPNQYETVWISMAMHHFSALEHICEKIHQSLRPGGLFVLNEYVGPNRFQFTERQKQIANLVLRLLPERYRRVVPDSIEQQSLRSTVGMGPTALSRRLADKIRDGDLHKAIWRKVRAERALISRQAILKNEIVFPTASSVISVDPSEAIRSEDIVDIVQDYFAIVERRPYGANIFQFLLSGIAGNFASDDPESAELIRMIGNIEETMIRCDEIRSDFEYIVAARV